MTGTVFDVGRPDPPDDPLNEVVATLLRADPTGERAGKVFRATFDQLYDGQHTGRYQWDQLYKTEKTHYGTLIEINLRRAFEDAIEDGDKLDYRIAGHEIDCKYSAKDGGWMLPPECFDELLLVATADDYTSTWSLGVVRARPAFLREGVNRDAKSALNPAGRAAIRWLHKDADLPPNILLHVDPAIVAAVLAEDSGQARLNEFFRRVTGRRIGRNTVATLALQDDYMKRARSNGGSRTRLAPEGYLILSGDYHTQRETAVRLGAEEPQPGEFVSIRIVPAAASEQGAVELDGSFWRTARPGEQVVAPAPVLENR